MPTCPSADAAGASLHGASHGAGDDSEDATSVIFHVDASTIRDAHGATVPLFGNADVKMDMATDRTLVIGFQQSLFLTVPPTCAARAEPPVVGIVTLMGEANLSPADDDDVIADVKWIDTDYIAVGYASGVLRVFHRQGTLEFEQKFHHAAIRKLDVSRLVTTRAMGSILRKIEMNVGDGEVWVLYEDATIAIVQIQELLYRIRTAVYGSAQANKFRKYVLRDQGDVLSAMPCGPAQPTIFQSHARLGVHTILSTGTTPFLSFYQAGHDQNSIIHLAHIATAIASKAAGAVWSFARSWGWSTGNATDDGGDVSSQLRPLDAAAEHVAAPLSSVRSIAEDPRRRSRVFVLSPNGRLAAVSDTLGRVLLIDTHRMMVIRMWKGYRYAQVGWMHGSEGNTRAPGLYLVIYSAQRGIVEVWRARYGPRVFSVAVGDYARLFSHFDPTSQQMRCVLLTAPSASTRLDVIALLENAPRAPILVKYFTQNKLQEENFLLHQIIGGIQAFVKKKRASTVGTLEVDPATPLLDGICNLASPTSIQVLLDFFLVPDMTILSANFVLKGIEMLQAALRQGMASHPATGTELSLLWQLQWRQRILSAFVGLSAEFCRAQDSMDHATKKSALFSDHLASDEDTECTRSRLVPWLELYRRAGYQWVDEGHDSFQASTARASEFTWWDFMECFSMPFSDSELPRRRDVISLYEQADSVEEFIRGTFTVLGVTAVRSSVVGSNHMTLIVFLFTPILSSVFAVQELATLHSLIFLPPDRFPHLFLQWYFALPIKAVLAIPPPSLSSSFQRWLQPYIDSWDAQIDMEQDNEEASTMEFDIADKRRLASCPQPLALVFGACVRTTKLFHAFVLAENCRWIEHQKTKAFEASTLGKYCSVDGGMRWCILEDCIGKTVHLSLRLGRLGKLSVEAVENVDDIIRAIALMQLNEDHDVGDPGEPVRSPKRDGHLEHFSQDAWVSTLETCSNASQMKRWQSVLSWFPQFNHTDSLYCFRASILCAAWNAERSDMQQLEDAVSELQSISKPRLVVAMGLHIWETYLRVHVVTLISFWEERAAGRKPQRGLQPQVARRFFGIIKNMLAHMLAAYNSAISLQCDCSSPHLDVDGDRVDGGDAEVGEEEACFTMPYLTSRNHWPCAVRCLRAQFHQNWPPSSSTSSLLQSLETILIDQVCRRQISDHIALILLLDSFAATSVTPVSVVKLFPNRGRGLCRPGTFMRADESSDERGGGELKVLQNERTTFLRQLVHCDENLGFALADAFGLPTQLIREDYVLFLYQSGKDNVADFSLDKIKHPDRIVHQLGSIARARLALVLKRMKCEPEFAMVMSILPADIFSWIVAEKTPPLVADPQVEKLDRAPSLTDTSALLARCIGIMQHSGPEFDKISAMSVLVKDVIARIKHRQQQQEMS